jgi:acetyl esterase
VLYGIEVARRARPRVWRGRQVAVAGNSVGGNVTAALSLMSKDRTGPKITYQVLISPATDASVDTKSYHEYDTGRFLPRAFMKSLL